MDEMAVYSQFEEQNINADRAKFVAWCVGIGLAGLAIGFGAGLAVSATAEPSDICGRYEMAGGAFIPTCADGR